MAAAKSNKQRRAELTAKRRVRAEKQTEKRLVAEHESQPDVCTTMVDLTKLAPDGSYSCPDFVRRGYYLDQPFTCKECGKEELWKATQQKWWYEVAKGNVWTTARLCRPCRRREREHRNEVRRLHLEGKAQKEQRKRNP